MTDKVLTPGEDMTDWDSRPLRTGSEINKRPGIIKANQQGAWGVCLGAFGPIDVGKTTFLTDAADSPYGSPLLMLDVEGGARSIAHRDDVDIIPITNEGDTGFQHLRSWINDIVAGKVMQPDTGKPYQSILLDNVSDIVGLAVRHIMRTVNRNIAMTDRPDQNDWGKVNVDLILLIRSLRDYARVSGVNVFFALGEAPEKNEITGVVKRDIRANPSFAGQFPGMIDMVGLITFQNNDEIREITFKSSDKTAARFRRSGNDPALVIPHTIKYRREQKPIVDILATLRGGQPWPTEKYSKESVLQRPAIQKS